MFKVRKGRGDDETHWLALGKSSRYKRLLSASWPKLQLRGLGVMCQNSRRDGD
jgi:hypothetical protein